ncbi:hypothetical protein [Arhodomonas sp. AD133]|uniref:hypothetical protein n=1 Tax=Arhodomonas sp. AD133 TaxID=3415009 RepID=UPI003EBD7E1F
MTTFDLGARVSFESIRDGRLTGTLVKFNRKTVTVLADEGRQWRVPPEILSPINDVDAGPAIGADDDNGSERPRPPRRFPAHRSRRSGMCAYLYTRNRLSAAGMRWQFIHCLMREWSLDMTFRPFWCAGAAALALVTVSTAQAEDLFGCKVLLCLASGNPPHECDPVLNRLTDSLKDGDPFPECPQVDGPGSGEGGVNTQWVERERCKDGYRVVTIRKPDHKEQIPGVYECVAEQGRAGTVYMSPFTGGGTNQESEREREQRYIHRNIVGAVDTRYYEILSHETVESSGQWKYLVRYYDSYPAENFRFNNALSIEVYHSGRKAQQWYYYGGRVFQTRDGQLPWQQ